MTLVLALSMGLTAGVLVPSAIDSDPNRLDRETPAKTSAQEAATKEVPPAQTSSEHGGSWGAGATDTDTQSGSPSLAELARSCVVQPHLAVQDEDDLRLLNGLAPVSYFDDDGSEDDRALLMSRFRRSVAEVSVRCAEPPRDNRCPALIAMMGDLARQLREDGHDQLDGRDLEQIYELGQDGFRVMHAAEYGEQAAELQLFGRVGEMLAPAPSSLVHEVATCLARRRSLPRPRSMSDLDVFISIAAHHRPEERRDALRHDLRVAAIEADVLCREPGLPAACAAAEAHFIGLARRGQTEGIHQVDGRPIEHLTHGDVADAVDEMSWQIDRVLSEP